MVFGGLSGLDRWSHFSLYFINSVGRLVVRRQLISIDATSSAAVSEDNTQSYYSSSVLYLFIVCFALKSSSYSVSDSCTLRPASNHPTDERDHSDGCISVTAHGDSLRSPSEIDAKSSSRSGVTMAGDVGGKVSGVWLRS